MNQDDAELRRAAGLSADRLLQPAALLGKVRLRPVVVRGIRVGAVEDVVVLAGVEEDENASPIRAEKELFGK